MPPVTSLTSFFRNCSFGDSNQTTRNQQELALILESAAHTLGDIKGYIAMSAGGAAFECGGLLASTFLSSVCPPLSALPLFTQAFIFGVSAFSDTMVTCWAKSVLEDSSGQESFWEQTKSQGSVRLMGILARGQCFAVVNILQGMTTVVCEEKADTQSGGLLGQMIIGVQCYMGSGAFGYCTLGVMQEIGERFKIQLKNVNERTLYENLRKKVSEGLSGLEKIVQQPLAVGPVFTSRMQDQEPVRAGSGGVAPAPQSARSETMALAPFQDIRFFAALAREQRMAFEEGVKGEVGYRFGQYYPRTGDYEYSETIQDSTGKIVTNGFTYNDTTVPTLIEQIQLVNRIVL